jgi:glycosyltransferase involved in cell wall biosynthesis
VLLATWFDFRQLQMRSALKRRTRQLTKTKQPVVTIIVYCSHHEKSVTTTLASIRRSTYSALQVVIIDNASRDHTSRVVRRFLRRHHDQRFRLYTKRQRADAATALQLAYKKVTYSPYILTLTAGDSLPPSFLKTAVAQLQLQPAVRVLLLRKLASDCQHIDQITPRLIAAAKHLVMRALYIVDWPQHPRRTTARLYYHEAFVAPEHSRQRSHYYAASALTTRHAQQISPKSASIIVGGLLLAGLSIPLYLAASLQTSAPLITVWLLLSGWAALATISDTSLVKSERILLLIASPIIYALVCAWLLVRGLSLLGGRLMIAIQRRRIGSKTKRRRNQHDVFNNVLPFKIWHKPTIPGVFRYQQQGRAHHGKMNQK